MLPTATPITLRRIETGSNIVLGVAQNGSMNADLLAIMAALTATKAAINLHTLLDLRGSIPTFIHISDGKTHEVRILDALTPEPGAFYLLDRGYLDFARLHTFHEAGSFFLIRAKRGLCGRGISCCFRSE